VKRTWLWLLVPIVLAGCASPAKTGVDLKQEAVALNEAGYDYYRQSRFDLAQGKFERALAFNRLIDRREGIAANLNNLGAMAQAQGNPEEAVRLFQEALVINRERRDPAAICETLNNLGMAYQARGRRPEAEAAFREALEYARQLKPGPLLALTLTHLGDVARARQDYPAALDYYHQAIRADAGSRDARGRAQRSERLGRTFLDLKDYDRAAMYLNEALVEFRRLQDTGGIAATLKGLTLVALARGDQTQARLNGDLLRGIYQARGQEQEVQELEALLSRGGGKETAPPARWPSSP
jgi:tetratricopeptide (TPR) repeat protein